MTWEINGQGIIRFFNQFAASIVTATTPVAFVAPALQAYPNPNPTSN